MDNLRHVGGPGLRGRLPLLPLPDAQRLTQQASLSVQDACSRSPAQGHIPPEQMVGLSSAAAGTGQVCPHPKDQG